MILSDKDISTELAYGDLEVGPVDMDEQLQPCSLDIRLGYEVGEYDGAENTIFDMKHSNMEGYSHNRMIDEQEGVIVEPDGFYLANTVEQFAIPDYLGASVKGRSSLGRMGIEVHSTAGWIDAGFGYPKGADIVLEISNNSNNPVRLYPGERVAQIVFYRMESKAGKPYNEKEDSKYNDQMGAVGSRIRQDYHNDE